jgi:hypothetical protein
MLHDIGPGIIVRESILKFETWEMTINRLLSWTTEVSIIFNQGLKILPAKKTVWLMYKKFVNTSLRRMMVPLLQRLQR